MPDPEPNYFVCTLGEAAQEGFNRPFLDVNHLIHQQASKHTDSPAIGFLQPSKGSGSLHLKSEYLTFGNILTGVSIAASLLSSQLNLKSGQTVGILADSSPSFLFTWLACIRIGCPVLLIAPQCASSAVAHLCQSCEVSVLFTDDKNEELAKEACRLAGGTDSKTLKISLLPFSSDEQVFSLIRKGIAEIAPCVDVAADDVAYLHHTSGTSSGLPKSIPQTHKGAVAVLPALAGESKATFTTTPLYHGGPADIFRAWTSGAMIWLYPSKDMPVTANNIVQCLDKIEGVCVDSKVKYFTSVPYILQMMAEDERGLSWLKSMDLVGVGGAALPVEVGDRLVRDHVNVVSRFGSAECGFLLSSHRQYEMDDAWQYLRLAASVDQLSFEPRDENLFELVIKPRWPHMAKYNRDDGSFATSDLFSKHPKIANAWRYHSRADSQLTLITGKKFDPAPIEDAVRAASSDISEILVFGNGNPHPGALIFRSHKAKNTTDKDIIESVSRIMNKLNKESQSHARIATNMLIPMTYREAALEKSSKGTVLRIRAEEKYAVDIEKSYNHFQSQYTDVTDAQLPLVIHDIIRTAIDVEVTQTLNADSDLFSYGVDSIGCARIRHGLAPLLPKGTKLPLTIVEDCGSVTAISDFVLNTRRGDPTSSRKSSSDLMPGLIQRYSKLVEREISDSSDTDHNSKIEKVSKKVLLTGPTGSLGAHVLSQLLQSSKVSHVYLLVRGSTQEAAKERVLKAMEVRKLSIPTDFKEKVTILQCKLSEPYLGISTENFESLRNEVDLILHLAWSVNFLLPLRSFAPHFVGIQNLLNLCLSSAKETVPRLVFCSSVASVTQWSNIQREVKNVPERIVADISVSGSIGYALSKLTAELILARAATEQTALRNKITVIRVGQLSADTGHGVWNASEAYPQILASAKFTDGNLPDLGDTERLTWLPVDIAAKAFVQASFVDPVRMGNLPTEHVRHKFGKSKPTEENLRYGRSDLDRSAADIIFDISAVQILHLLNPEDTPTFTDFVIRLQKELKLTTTTPQVKIVSAQQWLDDLERLQSQSQEPDRKINDSSTQIQSLLRLLPFWKSIYSDCRPSAAKHVSDDASSVVSANLTFDMQNSLINMPELAHWLGLGTLEARKHSASTNSGSSGVGENEGDVQYSELLTTEYVLKTWGWVQKNVP